MGENSLRSLDSLADFKKLYGLRLAGNRLRNLTANAFGHKSHLKMLNVADNLLEYIDIAAFESMKHLRVSAKKLVYDRLSNVYLSADTDWSAEKRWIGSDYLFIAILNYRA